MIVGMQLMPLVGRVHERSIIPAMKDSHIIQALYLFAGAGCLLVAIRVLKSLERRPLPRKWHKENLKTIRDAGRKKK